MKNYPSTDMSEGQKSHVSNKALPDAIHIVVVVYGKEYCDLLAEITLPNLASLIDEIPEELRLASKLRILTRHSDIAFIEKSPALPILRKAITVEILDALQMKGFEKHGDYGPMVSTQRHAVIEAAKSNAALFFVGPDQIYSRGSFALFIEHLRKGYRVVIGPGTRVKRSAARTQLRKIIEASPNGTFALSPKDQIELFFENWHPINDQFVIGSGKDIWWKAYLYHRPNPDYLLIRFFQGPTLVAWPHAIDQFDGFIDHDLILACCNNSREAYIIPDAAECLALDLTDEFRLDPQPLAKIPTIDLLRQFFNNSAIKDIQLVCGLRTCHVRRNNIDIKSIQRWEQELSNAVDPLIFLALIERPISKYFGKIIGRLFQLILIFNMNTFSTLIRLLKPKLLVRSKEIDPLANQLS